LSSVFCQHGFAAPLFPWVGSGFALQDHADEHAAAEPGHPSQQPLAHDFFTPCPSRTSFISPVAVRFLRAVAHWRDVRPMRALKFTVISAICVLLLWSLFAAVFLTHSSGKTSYGGFPVVDRQQLYDFLTSRGFARVPVVGPLDTAEPRETFRGSSHGSLPFFVTVSTRPGQEYGVYVQTFYEYRGFTWSVEYSTTKAREFADRLGQWLTEQRMRKFSARL